MACNPNYQSCLTTTTNNPVSQNLNLAHDPVNAMSIYARTMSLTFLNPYSYGKQFLSQTAQISTQAGKIAETSTKEAVAGTKAVYDGFKSSVGKGVNDVVDGVTSTLAQAETAVLRSTKELSTELATIGKTATGAVVDTLKIPNKIADSVTDTVSNIYEDLKKFAIIGLALLGAVFYWSRNHMLPALIMLAAVVLVFITPGIPDEIIVAGLGIISLVADKVL